MMDGGFDAGVVDLLEGFEGAGGDGGEVGGAGVVGNLVRALGAGDGAGDGGMHVYPAEGELGEGLLAGDEGADFVHDLEAEVVVHAGEGFAAVEGFAVAVVGAVVVAGEGGVAAEFAGEEAGGEGDAGEDADAFLFGLGEEEVGGALAEEVEDDLDGLDVGVFDGFEGFLDAFDADAVEADFAGLDEFVEEGKDLGAVVDGGGGAVELEEFEAVGFEVFEGAVHEGGEILAVVAAGGVGVEAAAGLGGDVELGVGAVAAEAGEEAFGVAVAVNVGGVEEVDAEVEGFVEGGEGLVIADGAPTAADGPATEANGGDFPASAAEGAVFHGGGGWG